MKFGSGAGDAEHFKKGIVHLDALSVDHGKESDLGLKFCEEPQPQQQGFLEMGYSTPQ